MRLRDLMSDEERQQEDDWQQAKWESLVSCVRRLSRADQVKWAEKQTISTKSRMREALCAAKNS